MHVVFAANAFFDQLSLARRMAGVFMGLAKICSIFEQNRWLVLTFDVVGTTSLKPFLLQHQLEDAYMLYGKRFQGNSLRINLVCEFYSLFLIVKVLFFQCQVLPQTL